MALIQTTLIWVVYAVVIALIVAIASVFVYVYQTPRERSAFVTIVSIFTLTSLLATILLLPVDVALVSSTTSPKLGRRKEWATGDNVDSILLTLKIVYYTLYSLDALLCLIVVPFTYFFYEEYDEVATEEGLQTFGSRFWGAFKYTLGFIALVVIIFVVGFFVPVAKDHQGAHYDLDFFKQILGENRKLIPKPPNPPSSTKLNGGCIRRRTGTHLRSRPIDDYRHIDLHSLHCLRICSTSCGLDQVRTKHLCTNPERKYCFSSRTEQGAPTSAGGSQWRPRAIYQRSEGT